MSGGRSGFIRQSLGVASSQYLARAVLLVRGLVAAAALGPVAFGAWNALTLILDYGSYASLGAIQGLDLVLPAAALRGEAAVARTTMAGAWWVTLVGGALFALAVIVHLASGSWLTLTGWGWSAPLLMLAAAFVQLAIQYHVSALRAHREFGAVSVALTLQAVVGGGLGMATVARAGVWGLLWSWLAGGTCALLWVRRDPRRPPLRPAHPDSGVKLALIGLPMFAFFALALMIRSFDRIALVRYGGNDALGVYSIGLIVAGMVFYVPEAAAAVLFPRVAAAAGGARDPEGTRAEVFMAQRAHGDAAAAGRDRAPVGPADRGAAAARVRARAPLDARAGGGRARHVDRDLAFLLPARARARARDVAGRRNGGGGRRRGDLHRGRAGSAAGDRGVGRGRRLWRVRARHAGARHPAARADSIPALGPAGRDPAPHGVGVGPAPGAHARRGRVGRGGSGAQRVVRRRVRAARALAWSWARHRPRGAELDRGALSARDSCR
jgi:hypothetical protein